MLLNALQSIQQANGDDDLSTLLFEGVGEILSNYHLVFDNKNS